jgi:hypothetical protein
MPKSKQPLLKRLKHFSKLQLAAIALVIIFATVAAYAVLGRNSSQSDTSGTSGTTEPSGQSQGNGNPSVNLNPPTPAQQQSTNDYKKNLAQPAAAPPTTSSGKQQVYPVVTSVTRSEVNAYVEGVIEDGGTCIVTATQGSQVVTASGKGSADVRNTNCVNIPITLSGGHWSVVVSYSSESYEGKSNAYPVNL